MEFKDLEYKINKSKMTEECTVVKQKLVDLLIHNYSITFHLFLQRLCV